MSHQISNPCAKRVTSFSKNFLFNYCLMNGLNMFIINRKFKYSFSERSTVFGAMSHHTSARCSTELLHLLKPYSLKVQWIYQIDSRIYINYFYITLVRTLTEPRYKEKRQNKKQWFDVYYSSSVIIRSKHKMALLLLLFLYIF
jgi:hypothetical protein